MADESSGGNVAGYGQYGLETLKDGKPPESRMQSAAQTQDFVRRLWDNDQKRSFKRSKVDGLVMGFPPYKTAKLRDAGRAEAANVNWGTARTYMESGAGAFYDLFSEAPGYLQVVTSFRPNDHKSRDEWSRIMSSEADRMIGNDPLFDYEIQQSIDQMVLHGCGPLFFEDAYKVLPRSCQCGDLKVPERTKSDTQYWEVCSIDVDYYPPQLFDFIQNEAAAEACGWNVAYTKLVIQNAMDVRQPNDRTRDWQFWSQELKNNSLSYYDDSLVCKLAHVFWLEFSGRVTHAIVERETNNPKGVEYCFFRHERYGDFNQVVHPFYYDRGQGGFHHSVTGIGVKMYGAMEYENRLLNNLFDKAFAPKILFRPTSAETTKRFELSTHGDWGLLPAGYEVQQVPIQGFLTDGLGMFRTSSELMKSNLSAYRQQVPMQESGNPPTKFQKQLEAAQQSALSKTTFNRYYKQLDILYTEIVRRLCNLNSTDKRAEEYQKRCIDKGVPRECFGRIETVKATRVIGQGSAFLREQAVTSLTPIAGSMPEDGRKNWMNDYISSIAGQAAVARYNPEQQKQSMGDEQTVIATLQVSAMRNGTPPIIEPHQNALKFAGVFLSACVQAFQSLQQGANPQEVVKFIDLCAPACMAHIKRCLNDPLRKQAAEEILKQLQQLEKMMDQVKKMLQQQAQQKKQQQQKTQQAMSDEAIKAQKAKSSIAISEAKAKSKMALEAARTKQQLAIADATAASDIHRNNRMAAFKE